MAEKNVLKDRENLSGDTLHESCGEKRQGQPKGWRVYLNQWSEVFQGVNETLRRLAIVLLDQENLDQR
ncbi:hypothetical protein AN958_08414 [Leucoagaricus sp. SymC.cos]|nr:hypothetical protein AN958_08414 [Leucoagaricus sp. SymC.cos]